VSIDKAKKNPAAQALVALRNQKLSAAVRKKIAEKAAAVRWVKKA